MGGRVIYWHQVGPRLSYDGDALLIEDLNPELRTAWRLSRWQVFKIGCKMAWTAWRA